MFEADPNNRDRDSINHYTALKQYSRSSADQETPLAHELRPEPVLQRSMVYLMSEIIDMCDDPSTNISDWFHFVWDRMRSIRKDITQQDLCSVGAVELVEQCARFHIHCAGRLIAEELSAFDPKLNTENLTKCLQSLKYMYHDLALKGIECPNEAEFRGYIILLNLNDSNFLWEIKQLKSKVQKSREIRFAISVYLAMDSNNYVKFFNLVRETNYLNACILMRYFVQIRTKALHIILKSYTPRTPISFPIRFFVDVLGFEDSDDVREFCENHGLVCDQDSVVLDRKFFFTPEYSSKLDRALGLVEVKRSGAAGEVICGKSIQPWESFGPYKPHDSFDENGLLKTSAWRAEDQNYYKKRDSELFLEPLPSPRLPSPRPLSTRSSFKPTVPPPKTNFTFSLSPTALKNKSYSEGFKLASFQETGSATSSQFQSPFTFPFGNSSSVSSNAISKPRLPSMNDNSFDEDYFDEEEDYIEDEAVEPFNENDIDSDDEVKVYDETEAFNNEADEVDRMMNKIHSSPPKLKTQSRKTESEILLEAQSICNRLVSAVVAEEVLHIAENECIRNESIKQYLEAQTDNQLNNYINQMLIQIAQDELIAESVKQYRYFIRWQRKTKERIAKRQILENIPVWIPTKQITGEDINIDPIKISFRKTTNIEINVPKERIEIDFQKVVAKMDTKNCTKSQIYWKVLISLPDYEESAYFHSFSKKILSSLQEMYRIPYANKMFNVCLRREIGSKMLDEDNRENQKIGNGTNGIIFFVTGQNLISTRERFKNILKQLESVLIPIIIVSCNSMLSDDYLTTCLELDYFSIDNNQHQQLEYYYNHISYTNNNPEPLRCSLETSLMKLADCHYLEYLYSIECQKTSTLFDYSLGDTLWTRFDTILNSNPAIRQATQNINFVISLFNNGLLKFKSIIEHDLSQYFSLPSEFKDLIPKLDQDIPLSYEHFPDDFKSIERKKLLENFINHLELQDFSDKYEALDSPIAFASELKTYLLNMFESDHYYVSHAYYKSIQYIQSILEFNASLDDDLDKASKKLLSWVGVIRIISTLHLQYKLDTFKSRIPNEVVYNIDELKMFTMSTVALLTKNLVCYANDYKETNVSEPFAKRQKFV